MPAGVQIRTIPETLVRMGEDYLLKMDLIADPDHLVVRETVLSGAVLAEDDSLRCLRFVALEHLFLLFFDIRVRSALVLLADGRWLVQELHQFVEFENFAVLLSAALLAVGVHNHAEGVLIPAVTASGGLVSTIFGVVLVGTVQDLLGVLVEDRGDIRHDFGPILVELSVKLLDFVSVDQHDELLDLETQNLLFEGDSVSGVEGFENLAEIESLEKF